MSKSKRPRQHYPLEEIIWDDAAGLGNGWMQHDEEPVPQHVISVGFVIKETDTYLVYASDTDNDGGHNGRTQIPKGMIKTRRILRKADKDKNEKTVASIPAITESL